MCGLIININKTINKDRDIFWRLRNMLKTCMASVTFTYQYDQSACIFICSICLNTEWKRKNRISGHHCWALIWYIVSHDTLCSGTPTTWINYLYYLSQHCLFLYISNDASCERHLRKHMAWWKRKITTTRRFMVIIKFNIIHSGQHHRELIVYLYVLCDRTSVVFETE